MNKKYMTFGLIGLFALAMVSAGLIAYYGQIEQTINVEQAVVLTCPEGDCSESLDGFSGDTLFSNVYTLNNFANSSREVKLISTYSNEIDTSYLKIIGYEYSQVWTENGEVRVEVEDTNDGWLQWTYTAVTPATSGKLKMTVEINNPTGFGITTFDDGSHDGWYYYDTEGVVRLGDYSGYSDANFETSLVTDGLRVRINKDNLPDTFMWQGFANFHLASNWIELDRTGSPWVPTGNAMIREVLSSPFTMDAKSEFDFVIVNEITDWSDGIADVVIETSVTPAA